MCAVGQTVLRSAIPLAICIGITIFYTGAKPNEDIVFFPASAHPISSSDEYLSALVHWWATVCDLVDQLLVYILLQIPRDERCQQ